MSRRSHARGLGGHRDFGVDLPRIGPSADVVPDDASGRPDRRFPRTDRRDRDLGPREFQRCLGVALRGAGPARRGAERRDGPAQDQGSQRRRRPAAAPAPRFEPGSKSPPDAPLGPRELRVATPQGVSSVGLVVVVDGPGRHRGRRPAANDRPAAAQKLTLPTVVSGRIGKAGRRRLVRLRPGERPARHLRGLGQPPREQDPRPADAPRPDPDAARQHGPRAGRRR